MTSEFRQNLQNFIERENISLSLLWRPVTVYKLMHRHRFVHFLAVGGSGVLLNLALTWLLTTYVFGLEKYFTAYLFGLSANILFSFVFYTITVFKTANDHFRRLTIYSAYIVVVVWIQAMFIKTVVPVVGLEWYLIVIASVIGFFAVINFLVFKLSIFKN